MKGFKAAALTSFLLFFLFFLGASPPAMATDTSPIPTGDPPALVSPEVSVPAEDDGAIFPFDLFDDSGVEGASNTIEIVILLTVLALAPSILIMVTAFTRIVIVLSFVRNAMGTQQMPPNQVLIGLALFLTFFVMNPIITDIRENAYAPLEAGEITQEVAFERALTPLREFMFQQIRLQENDESLRTFMSLSQMEMPETLEDIPTHVLIPSFIVSEIKTAFQIGFLLYIPFIVVDMVVASTLMSMGMMMLPPVMISLPFKIMLFILVDGWNLVVTSLVNTFT